MTDDKVFIVVLRQPESATDTRSDPFWEFGSFGCTSCHGSNLLHPRNSALLDHARLAFAQGGEAGFRLVFLTPHIRTNILGKDDKTCVECKWEPTLMPFRYACGPVLVDNCDRSDFVTIKTSVKDVNRTTWMGKFSSRFRSRTHHLEPEMAEDIVRIYENRRRKAPPSDVATKYEEALPYHGQVDLNRRKVYEGLLRGLSDSRNGSGCCHRTRRNGCK